MNKTFLAFLTTTLLSAPAHAEIDPNELVLKGLSISEIKKQIAEDKAKQKAKKKIKKPAAKKQTIAAKKKPKLNNLEPASGSKRKATTWFSSKKDGQRMSLTFTSRPKYTRAVNGQKIRLNFAAPVDYKIPEIPEKFRKGFKSLKEASKDGQNLVVEVTVNDGYTFNINHNNSRVFIDLTEKPEAVVAEPEVKPDDVKPPTYKVETKETKEAEVAAAEEAEEDNRVSGVKFDANSKGIERLVFDFPEASKAAMFQRLGNFWIVFETETELPIPEGIEKSNIFEEYKIVSTNPLIIKLPLKQRVFAIADKIGSRWEVEFDPSLKYEMEKPLQIFENKEYISISSSNAGEAVKIKDDVFGEEFSVIPLEGSGEGLEYQVSKKEVIFEPSVQGVVYREINEYADLKKNADGIKIFKLPEAQTAVVEKKKKPVFAFKKWHQLGSKDFSERKKIISKSGRYDYAEYLFTQKLYTEASVILKGLQGYKANFLNGASYFMEGKYDFALEAFNKVNLPFDVEENELLMWQIAANQKIYETRPHMVQDIGFTEDFEIPDNIKNYPGDIAAELILALAEKRAEDGEAEIAFNYLNLMPKTAQVRQYLYRTYLIAKLNDAEGKKVRARETWENLANKTTDNRVRGRAFYNLTMQDYELEKITRAEAIESLDKHRAVWRGDNFEYNLLTKLADMRYEEGNSSMALRNYKEALKAFPKHPNNIEISKIMRKVYKETILQDFSDSDKTYDALATYYEFEELKPIGEQGEHITLELAEKLVALDLLSEASKILKRYAKKVVDPEERILVMTRVAILHYLNNETDLALKMLASSEMKDMPEYLQSERDILRTEIYIKAKEYDNAKLLLPKIRPNRAQKFETEILWRMQDWKGLIAAYKKQINLEDEDIIKITVAHALLGDQDDLENIKDKYQNRMSQSRYAKSFAFVTGDNVVDYLDLAKSLDIGLAKDTVSSYRKRLKFGDLKKSSHNDNSNS